MAKITFVQPDGTSQTVDAEPGVTVMEAAKINSINGVDAECGGACACATCHVYVDEAWREKTGKAAAMEEDMLDFAFDVQRRRAGSACQIKITAKLSMASSFAFLRSSSETKGRSIVGPDRQATAVQLVKAY